MKLPDGGTMKRLMCVALALAVLSSCTTVLRKDLMETGVRDVSFRDLTTNPELYKGKLFILGGTIIHTMTGSTGTVITALYIPVDSSGYLKHRRPAGRFIAIYPRERGLLDPIAYGPNNEITLAGVFMDTQKGKVGNVAYVVPVFRIEEIYRWPTDPYYTYYQSDFASWGPYWGPFWGPYWGPPWWPHLYP